MGALTNLRIGTEHRRLDWGNQQREKRMGNHDKSHIDEERDERFDITVELITHFNIKTLLPI